jgi:hypothetical protein
MNRALFAATIALLASAGALHAQAPPAPGAGVPVFSPEFGGGLLDGRPQWLGSDPPDRVWFRAEYLLWWVKNGPLPYPLVTTGPGDSDNPGALGHGGVPILTGPNVHFGALSGVRLAVGAWCDPESIFGIEASGFALPRTTKTYRAVSDAGGNPVLTFRYLDPPDANGVTAEDAFQAAVPPGNPSGVGPFAGGLAVTSTTTLWGAEVNMLANLGDGGNRPWHFLAGFRYANLEENLNLQFVRGAIDPAVVVFQGNPFPAPSQVASSDSFRVRNRFYGGQVGIRGQYEFGSLFVGGCAKVAVGATQEVLDIAGASTLTSADGTRMTAPGGQFAAPSNMGRYSASEFTVIPEVELKVGYQITPLVRCFVGYDFFYWSRVIRPGSQVDLVVDTRANQIDPGFVPGSQTTFPQPRFTRTDFWGQGLSFGLELNF